jgi:hypothetical protein
MGQYFNLANNDKRVNFSESKMMEWAYVGNETVEAAMTLLRTTWKKNSITTCGDYAYDTVPYDYDAIEFIAENIDYEISQRGYIYNVTKLEKISMKKYIQQAFKMHYEWKEQKGFNLIHPLPLITKSEGDGGGGDYNNGHDEMVGAWSGDVIFTSYSNLKRYKDITHLVYHQEQRDFTEENDYLKELQKIKNKPFIDKIKKF